MTIGAAVKDNSEAANWNLGTRILPISLLSAGRALIGCTD